MAKNKQPSQEKISEVHNALNDFVVGYFFMMKPRLHNAKRLWAGLRSQQTNNGLLEEIILGYVNSALMDFSLNLYDAIQLLRDIHEFEYSDNSDINHMMRFRRNIVAHRGKNWNSPESEAVRKQLFDNPQGIIETALKAAKEFALELKQKQIPLDPGETRPGIPNIMPPEVSLLFNSVPATQIFISIPSENELIEFFGKAAITK